MLELLIWGLGTPRVSCIALSLEAELKLCVCVCARARAQLSLDSQRGLVSLAKLKTTEMEAPAVALVDLGHSGIIYPGSLSFFFFQILA